MNEYMPTPKGCPFCGELPRLKIFGGMGNAYASIRCDACKMEIDNVTIEYNDDAFIAIGAAIEKWNKRTGVSK